MHMGYSRDEEELELKGNLTSIGKNCELQTPSVLCLICVLANILKALN